MFQWDIARQRERGGRTIWTKSGGGSGYRDRRTGAWNLSYSGASLALTFYDKRKPQTSGSATNSSTMRCTTLFSLVYQSVSSWFSHE